MSKYAEKIVKGNEITAQFKECPKFIKMTGHSRTALLRHLKNVHNINVKKQAEAENSQDPEDLEYQSFAKKTVADFLKPKQTLPEIVSEMTIEGASIRFITRNNFIRDSMTASGFKLPISALPRLCWKDCIKLQNRRI